MPVYEASGSSLMNSGAWGERVHGGLELLDRLHEVVASAHAVLAVGEGLLPGRDKLLRQLLVEENFDPLGNGIGLAVFGRGERHDRALHGSRVGLAALGEGSALELSGQLHAVLDLDFGSQLDQGLVVAADPHIELLPFGRSVKGEYVVIKVDNEGGRGGGGSGRRLKANDLELPNQSRRQCGLALVEQGLRLANDLRVGGRPVRAEDSLDTFHISVHLNRLVASGGHKKDVKTLFFLGQRIALHNDDYVFCHLADSSFFFMSGRLR